MALKSQEVTVSDEATLLVSGGSITDPVSVVLRNASGQMYLGGPDVDTDDGFPYSDSDGAFSMELGPGDDLYAIVAAEGSETVIVLANRQDT